MKKITKIDNKIETKLKTKVAAYCRVSTDSEDQLLSLEAQKEHYKDLIKNNPEWTFAGLYYDEGISGTKKENRFALMKMIHDCETGKIDLIITKSISRFARNTTDCLELVRTLTDLGIYIIFEKENINTKDMEGELMLSILSSLAEEESVSISQNTKWSIQNKFKDGTFITSCPPYGYKNVNGRMEIVPEEAEVVKEIFSKYLAGESSSVIATYLQDKGIKTKRGGKWQSSTIIAILKNERYIGDAVFQKTWKDESYNRHYNYGEQDKYLVKNHHEPIVSREDYMKVQDLMVRRFAGKGGVRGSDKYSNRYVFSGRIICGACGSILKRKIRKGPGSTYIEWVCKTHIADKDSCHMKSVKQVQIEKAFVNMMNKLSLEEMDLSSNKDHSKEILEIENMERKIDENSRARRRLQTLMTQGLLDADIYNDENNELLSEGEKLMRRLSDMKAEVSDELNKALALDVLKQYLKKESKIQEFDEDAFDRFIDKAIIHSRGSIEFILKCGLHLEEDL